MTVVPFPSLLDRAEPAGLWPEPSPLPSTLPDVPAFVAGSRITLLPAFSPLAAGFDVRAGLPYEMGDPCIVAASGRRAVTLGRLSRLRAV